MSNSMTKAMIFGLLIIGVCHAAEPPIEDCQKIKLKFWDVVAGAFGAGPDLKGACLKGVQDGLELRARQAEIERLAAERDLHDATAETKSLLTKMWIESGLPEESARAIADTYEPGPATDAIIVTVRSRGSQSAITGIKNALDNFNYLLANQLLLAGTIVKAEEDEAARKRSGDNPAPRQSIQQGEALPAEGNGQR